MSLEIEKKFLVDYKDWNENKSLFTLQPYYYIRQGYIPTITNTVRIRLVDIVPDGLSFSFVTLKGKSHGLSRSEYEYEIPVNDAKEIMEEMCSTFIEKYRFLYKDDLGNVWEFDEFLGDNRGLVIAEIEFDNINSVDSIKKPFNFIGEELTNPKYSNYNLSKNPYNLWKE